MIEHEYHSSGCPAANIPVYVATVHTGHSVCHVTADTTVAGLTDRLGEYVRQHAVYQLWPEDTEHAMDLLSAGSPGEAVDFYFEKVGERWDRERLVVTFLELPLPARGREAVPIGAGRSSEDERR